jgi:hypothetical protein
MSDPIVLLWLATIGLIIHVLLGALQSGSFNSMLAVYSLPPINVKVFPWLGLLLGLAGGVVLGVQNGDPVLVALAKAVSGMVAGGSSALHLETVRGALPANTPGAGGSLQVVAVQRTVLPVVPAAPVQTRAVLTHEGRGRFSITWPAIGIAVVGACAAFVFAAALPGCAQFSNEVSTLVPSDVQKMEQKILADLAAGYTLDQIIADVAKSATGDVLQIVSDYVASLLDSALLTPAQRSGLSGLQKEAVQRLVARDAAHVDGGAK